MRTKVHIKAGVDKKNYSEKVLECIRYLLWVQILDGIPIV
jgi:hypothetical protein